jgi:hypothetical protein
MTTIVIVVIVGGIFGLCAWPYFADLCARTVIPFIRRKLGDAMAEPLATLLTLVDRPACICRKTMMSGWRFLTGRVNRLTSRYTRKSPTIYYERTTSHVVNPDSGKTMVHEVEYEIPWEDVPQQIRDEMNRTGARTGEVNVKGTVVDTLLREAEKQEIELTV